MTPDEAFEQFDNLIEIRDTLREIFEEKLTISGDVPYIKTEVFRDIENQPTPLRHTTFQFEIIMNTLLGSFGSYRSFVAVSLLSHLTTMLDTFSVLVAEMLSNEADHKLKSGEVKLDPDALDRLLKEKGIDGLERYMSTPIPDVYLRAFDDMKHKKNDKDNNKEDGKTNE